MKNLLLIAFITISTLSFGQNPPVAVDDSITSRYDVAHSMDSILIVGFSLIANDTDADGDSLFLHDVIYSGTGNVDILNSSGFVGAIYYTPQNGFWGTDSIICIIRDNGTPVRYDTSILFYTIQYPTFAKLDANNILAHIDKDVLFSTPGRAPGFEVPVGSNSHSIFASNLWVSGSNSGTIYTNIRQFGDSTFFDDKSSNCGPVNDYTYQSSEYDGKWDRVWKVKQYEIDYHLANWNNANYNAPLSILEWPAHGDTAIGEAFYLAPFVDVNGDGVYQPSSGEFPYIKGDQSVFFIYNDANAYYSDNSMQTEVRGMVYSFSCPDSALQNTVFVDFKIINHSNKTYDSTFFGMWVDGDLGNPDDDAVQCDVDRSLYFTLNGDSFDDDTNGKLGYGNYPPAQGTLILKGAKQDNDGQDNDVGIGTNQTINGSGFDDGIVDNEHWGMEYFGYLINNSPVLSEDKEYYSLLRGTDINGNQWAYDFLNTGTPIPFKYMFPGSSDTYNYGTGGIPVPPWTDVTNTPADKRTIASTGPVTFAPGDEIELTYAFVFGRDYVNTGAQAGVTSMLERADSIRSYYNQGMLTACGFPVSVKETVDSKSDLVIYPNPTNNLINIRQEKANSITIQVLDITGKVLLISSSTNQLTTIDLSKFTNGIYLVRVSNGTAVSVQKIIKQ